MIDSRFKMRIPLIFRIENSLGPLELEVMKIIWKENRATVRVVVGRIQVKRPIAYTTVMTVMDNLFKKGFLKREKIDRSFRYASRLDEDHAITNSLAGVFRDLSADYGREKVLYSAIRTGMLPKITIEPVGYGFALTIILAVLGFSVFDLMQNLKFFGVFDYFNLLISEPVLFITRLHIFLPAFLEILPVVNILTTTVSLVLLVILSRKLSRILHPRVNL